MCPYIRKALVRELGKKKLALFTQRASSFDGVGKDMLLANVILKDTPYRT
jgi:hypothetical protein